MGKKNLTIQLDEDVIRRAKVMAAKSDTSVSSLVARLLERTTAAEDGYEQAKRHALEVMRKVSEQAVTAGETSTGRTWTREDLHDRTPPPTRPSKKTTGA